MTEPPDPEPPDPWCATTARERGDSLVATASRVERWLLVEHASAWGPEGVPSGRMPRAAARALAAAALRARARLVLVRRVNGRSDGGRMVFAVDSRPGRERVLAQHVTQDAGLLALDPPYDGPVDGWDDHEGRLHLVCTHGSHDRCCATRGRPVALAVAEAYGDAAWECSHIGGERFAANVLVLPEGHYFGHVEPHDVVPLLAGLDRGVLDRALWRGRSSLPLPVQAAQAFAGDLALERQTTLEPDVWEVLLAGGVRVVVRYDRAGELGPHVLVCGGLEAKRAPVFRLVSLEP